MGTKPSRCHLARARTPVRPNGNIHLDGSLCQQQSFADCVARVDKHYCFVITNEDRLLICIQICCCLNARLGCERLCVTMKWGGVREEEFRVLKRAGVCNWRCVTLVTLSRSRRESFSNCHWFG